MKRSQHDMKRISEILIVLFLVLLVSVPAVAWAVRKDTMTLTISDQISHEVYYRIKAEAGDQLSFGWEHSFEHVTWNEFYTVLTDGTLKLDSIAVGGFGAGIPAEMDCTYRYEDGLVYMDDLQESTFPKLTWIHSQTQVKFIALNGEQLVTGEDLPQRAKIQLEIVP